MDTMSTSRQKTLETTGCTPAWVDQMYVACEALSAPEGGTISALSVTVPRGEGSGSLAQVELLAAALSELYHLEVTVKSMERSVTVRFALPAPGRNSDRISSRNIDETLRSGSELLTLR